MVLLCAFLPGVSQSKRLHRGHTSTRCEALSVGAGGTVTAASMAVSRCPACRCPGVPLSWRELVANVSTSTRCKPFNVGAGASVTAWRAVARDRCHFCDCYEKPLQGNDRPA